MLAKLLGDTKAFVKGFFAGQIVDNRLDPYRLAAARAGYKLQSQTFRIRERYRIFSPGPPRLQVWEANHVIPLLFLIIWAISFYITMNFLLDVMGKPKRMETAALTLAITSSMLILLYIIALYDNCREPGYEWPDWKEHKD